MTFMMKLAASRSVMLGLNLCLEGRAASGGGLPPLRTGLLWRPHSAWRVGVGAAEGQAQECSLPGAVSVMGTVVSAGPAPPPQDGGLARAKSWPWAPHCGGCHCILETRGGFW